MLSFTKPSGPYTLNTLTSKANNIIGLWGFSEGSGTHIVNTIPNSLSRLSGAEGNAFGNVTTFTDFYWETINNELACNINRTNDSDQYFYFESSSQTNTMNTGSCRVRCLAYRNATEAIANTGTGNPNLDANGFYFAKANNTYTATLFQNGKFAGGGANFLATPNNALTLNTIMDIVFTWGSNGTYIYINGTEQAADATATFVPNSAVNWQFGCRVITGISSFADFRSAYSYVSLYDDQLSQEDVDWLTMWPYIEVSPLVYASYPIDTEGALADQTIYDYRATRINNRSILEATLTEWNFSDTWGNEFTMRTGSNTTASANILGSGLNYLDLWLPPYQEYYVRTRQLVNGSYTPWSPFHSFMSLGYINSYEKAQILNRGTQTIY